MPNWCNGCVKVKGEPKNIEKFCKLFLFDDTKETQKKYFARSFAFDNWKNFKKNNLGEDEAEFGIDFAWSVTSCLISGYPQDNPKTCLTLVDACKKYKVDVVIDGEEGGMGFEEHIECNRNGELIEECFDMPAYSCKNCKNQMLIPSSYDVKEEECIECSHVGEWEGVI